MPRERPMTRAQARLILDREAARPDHLVARTCLNHTDLVKWDHPRTERSSCPSCGR
jgi:hypothetical protein